MSDQGGVDEEALKNFSLGSAEVIGYSKNVESLSFDEFKRINFQHGVPIIINEICKFLTMQDHPLFFHTKLDYEKIEKTK